MAQPQRVHVPAKLYAPMKARNDVYKDYPTMAPIQLGDIRLTDLIQHGAKVIPGAHDLVFSAAPYTVMRLYLTWPGYAPQDPIYVNLYADGAGAPPTRASVALQVARQFFMYLERCKTGPQPTHPSVQKWRIDNLGYGRLTPFNIIVKALVNTYENVWQIDCDIIV